jgi:hypothetical protein
MSSVGSIASPYEYEPVLDTVEFGDRLMVFSVYRGNYGGIRFNLSLVNLGDGFSFEDLNWSYFDAEIYDSYGEFLGYVRGEEDEEPYMLFLAPYGMHVRTWRWNKQVVLDGEWTRLSPGEYQVVGVFRGVKGEIRTDVFVFYLSRDWSPGGYSGLTFHQMVRARIESGFMYASVGVLVMGFFEDRFLVWLRGRSCWKLDWGRNRTVLWMATVILSILMLGMTSMSGFLYDVFWV